MNKVVTNLAAALLLAASASAQVIISASDTPVVIDFDSTISGVSNGQFAGSGFSPTPTAGQLDSDAWSMTGMSDGTLAFGGTGTGDFARGITTGGVTTGGVYALGSSDFALMIQPGSTDWTPGTLVLKTQNAMGTAASKFSISYDLYVNNDQDRSNSFNFSYSLDGGANFITDGLSNALFTYTSTAPLDASGWILVGTASASITLSSNLANGQDILFQWSGDDIGGSGSRDEFGVDNISVGMTAIPEPSTYAAIMGLITFAVVMVRRRRNTA